MKLKVKKNRDPDVPLSKSMTSGVLELTACDKRVFLT